MTYNMFGGTLNLAQLNSTTEHECCRLNWAAWAGLLPSCRVTILHSSDWMLTQALLSVCLKITGLWGLLLLSSAKVVVRTGAVDLHGKTFFEMICYVMCGPIPRPGGRNVIMVSRHSQNVLCNVSVLKVKQSVLRVWINRTSWSSECEKSWKWNVIYLMTYYLRDTRAL